MKPGYMVGIIAICLLMTIEQLTATKCLKAFYGGSSTTDPPVDLTLSSQLDKNKYGVSQHDPENCVDGDINTFCHTKDENNPFFMVEYASPTNISQVKVKARKNCCWDRVKEVVVIVTDTKPTKGQLALGTQLGSTFHGPATRGGQEITFTSESGVTGKYVIVQQQYEGVMNLAEVEINPENLAVAMSSQYGSGSYPADNCVDGNEDTFCHTEDEENPYFVIEYPKPTKIYDVKVIARKNCCWDRVKELAVIVTNTQPTKGESALYSGSQLGSTFDGPATNAAQVITFKSTTGITGKYVIVQQQYKGVMNLAEVQVNKDHVHGLYLKKLKNVYTNCIENPGCEGCASIVKKHLPKLLQKNIIKEGEIGVNDGSLSYIGAKEENYLKQWATTLNFRKVGDIKTIRTDNEMVTVNATVSGTVGGKRNYGSMKRRPTGLYAGPGDLVTLTFPEDLVGKVSIDIGHFHHILSFPVEASVVKVGSPYGGLIIVWMKEKDSYTGEFTVSVTNAVRAPCFVYGKTKNEEWEEMRHYSPKWSVLRVLGQVEIFVQTLQIKDITDMNATMSRIKDTMDLLEESVGLPAGSKPGAEILIIDPARGGGYHAGICTPGENVCGTILYTEDKVNTDTYYDDFFKQDGTNPLVLHEFGHGFCLGDFPAMGSQWTAETVSAYIRYTKGRFEKHYDVVHAGMVKKDLDFWLLERLVGFSTYSGGKACGEVNFNSKQFDTNDYERCWKWLNWFPERAHGWHIWKDVNTMDAKSTKHYTKGTDRMIDLYCNATKHNLLPMFKWYNIEPSDEAITINCAKLPESDLITKWLNVAECVNQSMTTGDKDIRECGKMPRFPEHKGLCVISGVCNKDKTNNEDQTTMNEKFDLYGSTGKRLNFADKKFPKKSTAVQKKKCLERASEFFKDCKNKMNQPMTATFYEKEVGNKFNYKTFNYTFPTPGIGPFDSARSSSTYNNQLVKYGPQNSIGGEKNKKFFHSNQENYPWLEIKLRTPTKISDVTIVNRKGCCGERLKNAVIRAGMSQVPEGTANEPLTINEACGTYQGPAATGATIKILCSQPIMAQYITIQLENQAVLQVTEVRINTKNLAVTMSSQLSGSYPADNCVDGNEDTFCHTQDEENPYFVIEYPKPTKINDVKVIARKNCCWDRVKELAVIVTNTKPSKGQSALDSGSQLGSTFDGPATQAAQEITFKSTTGITGKYVIVQQQYKGVLNLAEVQVNKAE